jgi:hypothetical protein
MLSNPFVKQKMIQIILLWTAIGFLQACSTLGKQETHQSLANPSAVFTSIPTITGIQPSFTPSPMPVLIPSPTGQFAPSQVVPSPAPISTILSTQVPGKPIIIAIAEEKLLTFDQRFQLINSFDARERYLVPNPDGYLYGKTYDPHQKCFLISKLDLEGRVIQEIQSWIDLGSDGMDIYQFSLSPDRKWISYLRASGEKGRSLADAKYQNVELVAVNEVSAQKPIQITTSGAEGPATPAWSPDGKFLAYVDEDKYGTSQVFLYEVENAKKIQLTAQGQPFNNIVYRTLQWAPDSGAIAFRSARQKGDGDNITFDQYAVGIIALETKILDWLNLDDFGAYIPRSIYWDKNSARLLILVEQEKLSSMIWYVVETDAYNRVPVPDARVYQALPLNDQMTAIVLVGSDFFLYYDAQKESFKEITNEFVIKPPEMYILP